MPDFINAHMRDEEVDTSQITHLEEESGNLKKSMVSHLFPDFYFV